MLALMAMILYGGLALVVVFALLTISFKLLLMTLVVLRSAIAGILIVVSCGALATAASVFLVPKLMDWMPSFHKVGDGGWGLGTDLVAEAAIKVLLPMTAAALFCLLAFGIAITIYSPDPDEQG